MRNLVRLARQNQNWEQRPAKDSTLIIRRFDRPFSVTAHAKLSTGLVAAAPSSNFVLANLVAFRQPSKAEAKSETEPRA